MILGKLKNIGRYAGLYANLDKAIRFLEENNPMDFEAGSYPIDGDEVYMNRFDYWTEPEGEILRGTGITWISISRRTDVNICAAPLRRSFW